MLWILALLSVHQTTMVPTIIKINAQQLRNYFDLRPDLFYLRGKNMPVTDSC